jgi:hypothetical protein
MMPFDTLFPDIAKNVPVWQRQEVQAVLPAMTARRKNSGSGDGKPTSTAAPGQDGHEWEFKARFRRHAFGWRSQPAITRIRQAVSGLTDEAYRRYGLLANQGGTYLATFRAVAKKYSHKTAGEILADLVKTTPGDESKWFAAVKDAGLYDEAIALASRTPCDPKTLARAARDFAEKQPSFAVSAGLLALHWLVQGYGYEITSADVWDAYRSTLAAGERLGNAGDVKARIRKMLAAEGAGARFVTQVLGL